MTCQLTTAAQQRALLRDDMERGVIPIRRLRWEEGPHGVTCPRETQTDLRPRFRSWLQQLNVITVTPIHVTSVCH
jgi:hypothetical protein